MIYFISDIHFYHEKIIEYANRPFKDIEEMNNTLIDNWNKKVKLKDEVYILGDFSFGNKEQTLDLLDKLNGRKYLIKKGSVFYGKEKGPNIYYSFFTYNNIYN